MKYTETILSNSTRKLLWFEIIKMLIAVLRNKFILSFIRIFGTLSFPMSHSCPSPPRTSAPPTPSVPGWVKVIDFNK